MAGVIQSGETLQVKDGSIGGLDSPGRGIVGLVAAAFGSGAGLVNNTDGSSGIAVFSQDLGEVALIGVQVPGKAGVAEPHDAVGMRVATGEDGGSRGTAAGGDAEAVLEADALCGEGVEIGGLDGVDPVGMEILTEVVAVDEEDVGT